MAYYKDPPWIGDDDYGKCGDLYPDGWYTQDDDHDWQQALQDEELKEVTNGEDGGTETRTTQV